MDKGTDDKERKALESFLGSYAGAAHADKLAAEYDSMESTEHRAELEQAIQKQIEGKGTKRNKLFSFSRVIAVALLGLVCLGAVGYEVWNYIIRDNHTNSTFLTSYSHEEIQKAGFHLIPYYLPPDYEMLKVLSYEHVRQIFYDNGKGEVIVFTESDRELSEQVDTENIAIEKVIIPSGYEGILNVNGNDKM